MQVTSTGATEGPIIRGRPKGRQRLAWALACLVLAGSAPACTRESAASFDASSAPVVTDTADAIRTIVADPAAAQAQVTRLYEPGAYAPLWVDASGAPGGHARDALALLRSAAAEGLDPADYDVARLDGLSAGLARVASPEDVAAFDVALSVSMLRYFDHIQRGRVDPQAIGFRMSVPADDRNSVETLRGALAAGRLGDAAADLAPPLVLYRSLRSTLARYRALAVNDLPDVAVPTGRALKPGEAFADAAALHERLAALGDLPGDAPRRADGAVYDDGLVDGIRRFQTRHGLDADGIVGRATQAALDVALTVRVRQLELALERLRWLPRLDPQRFLAVNIPMFRLWVWDSVPADGAPTFGLNVIVGRALNTQTPVFVEEMRYLIFRPYWNVPASIVRGELLPAVRRDPDYFDRHDYEIVSGQGDDAPVVALTPESLEQLERGRLRLRQRPGPGNALGLVKFVFPNDENVYLHGTPTPQLFGRPRRDFSHGCVRVEDPVALAEWALSDQSGWTRERILAAMHGARPVRVNLTRPIQVILFYMTAVVMPEDGTVHFADDIYGHDARLDSALRPQS